MNPLYKIIERESLSDVDRNIFAELLKKQGKVEGDLSLKADRCKEICIAYIDNIPVAIGGIKKKTKSDFGEKKANILICEKDFDWELGYIYTDENYSGKGISSSIVKQLLERNENENLMASTEVEANPFMVKILEKNGFIQKGKTWKSVIHGKNLGLFLRNKTIIK
ncbi:GNAT family N-acetyltransferase [Flavobacterium caseinilyticum]|uniref:GNAT family N-acetyltransferase n=1 Tax=Flavobacterium caseinilyticum TaxID=2541732 RepID=A0A4R5AT54_9FLAO|nr:GNAT family N-acetyltransferase [Flavobacterium caseinilyticum]TDD74866.1 GNAT family N-acetyltransferase [Flavobacterium caseinilyticum]